MSPRDAAMGDRVKWIKMRQGGYSGFRGRFRIGRQANRYWALWDAYSQQLTEHRLLRAAKDAAELILEREAETGEYARYWYTAQGRSRKDTLKEQRAMRKAKLDRRHGIYRCTLDHAHQSYCAREKCQKAINKRAEDFLFKRA